MAPKPVPGPGFPRIGSRPATVGGLLQSVKVGRRLVQIQVEYSPRPDPRIVAVAAWEGRILLRKSYPLDRPLDEREKDRLLAIRSREFTSVFREMLVQRAKDRLASVTSVPAELAAPDAGSGPAPLATTGPRASETHPAPAVGSQAGLPLQDVAAGPVQLDGVFGAASGESPVDDLDPLSLFAVIDFEPPELVVPVTEADPELGAREIMGVTGVQEPDRGRADSMMEVEASTLGAPGSPDTQPLKVPSVVKEAVREISTLHGVLVSAFITRDGADRALVAVQGQPTPSESFPDLWRELRSKLDILGRRWQLGELLSYLGEGEQGFYVLFPAGSLGCFVVLVSAEQSPGLIKKSIERIIRGG